MNSIELKNEQELFGDYIYNYYKKTKKKCEPILDGIVDEKKYLESKFRIAWLLKEAYDEKEGEGGGWSLTQNILNQSELYPVIIKNSPTWQPMIYVTYSILNGFIPYSDMNFIRDLPIMAQCLNEIALININKMPGITKSNENEITLNYLDWRPILHWQLKIIDPQIFIFGNTFHHYKKDLFTKNVKMKKLGCVEYCIEDDKLYISAYHPAQTQVERKHYVQSIINVVKKWDSL